jgi:ATP-dependent exoDNAse (exonuclease V) beta subunit
VLGRYRAEKNRRGLLDYDDLIDKTLRLLSEDAPHGCTTSSTSASTTC